MRVLLISGASLRIAPYAFPYFDVLQKNGADVTALVWNRDGKEDVKIDERIKVKYHNDLLDDAVSKKNKIAHFLKFRRFILREFKEADYQFVVVLDTQFAVLICDVLKSKYRNRFIYDMRDPSLEGFWVYRKIVASIVKSSAGVVISSDGFRQYFDKQQKIHTSHNIKISDLNYKGIRNNSDRNVSPIRLSFWGCIRETDICINLVNSLKGDNRFEVHFYGRLNNDSIRLKHFCEQNDCSKVFFHGEYIENERINFAKKTDMILNIHSSIRNNRMGNKYYDGLIFQIPQVCSKGGMMESMVSGIGIGIGIEIIVDDKLGDTLYDYYHSIDWDKFRATCNQELDRVLKEYEDTNNFINEIIKSI